MSIEILSIERRLAEATARVMARAEERKVTDQPSQINGHMDAAIGRLLKSGYPARHVKRAVDNAMHGPGLEKAKALLPKVMAEDCILLLTGDRGPGKTQIATWWALQRLCAGKSAGTYVKLVDLLADIKRTWHGGGKNIGTEDDILRKYRNAALLVIDEVQEIGGHDFEVRYLTSIIDHRYDAMRATVMIANLDGAALAASIPASIIDRANETGGQVVCDWPSYRTGGRS
jgi:DNA replication protein DnaC